jgi:hypothetical protein
MKVEYLKDSLEFKNFGHLIGVKGGLHVFNLFVLHPVLLTKLESIFAAKTNVR